MKTIISIVTTLLIYPIGFILGIFKNTLDKAFIKGYNFRN